MVCSATCNILFLCQLLIVWQTGLIIHGCFVYDRTRRQLDRVSLDNNTIFPYQNFRLPDSVIPYKYELRINPDWHAASDDRGVTSFNGTVSIWLEVREATDKIIVNADDLTLTSVSLYLTSSDVSGSVGSEVGVKDISYDYVRLKMIYFGLNSTIPKHQKLVLIIAYSGKIKELDGFYRSSYYDSKGIRHHLLTTQFEPTSARQAFPCFDEPNFKAIFQISIVRPEYMIALSNMPLMYTQPIYDDSITKANDGVDRGNPITLYIDTFKPTVIMSTYLVAFVVCDFSSISTYTDSNILVSIYTPPEQISQAKFALEVAVKSLQFLEGYFDIGYPLPKIDMIGIPDFLPGAMENWGLITYRMVSLLYKPNVTSIADKESIAVTVAHELAHQWFGNLVTMTWWNDLWLNEGFATYISYVCLDHIYDGWNLLEQFTALDTQSLDGLKWSHAINNQVNDPDSIESTFDSISYDKGALMLRMLDGSVLTHSEFRNGLQSYLKKNSYKNARSIDLWNSLQNASNKCAQYNVDLNSIMSGWINQKGFPLVTLSDPYLTSDNKTVINISQTKFGTQYEGKQLDLTDQTVYFEDTSSYTWQIPYDMYVGIDIKYTSTLSPESVWLFNNNVSYTITNCDPESLWVKGNTGYKGYYVVKYGPNLWENLVRILKENPKSLPAIDKTQLLHDTELLMKFGYMDFSEGVDLYTYVNPRAFDKTRNVSKLAYKGLVEQDAQPLISLLDILFSMRSFFRNDGELYNTLWPNFINNLLLISLIERYNWRTDLTYQESILQSSVISKAVSLGHEESIKRARDLFEIIIYKKSSNKESLSYPDMISAILTTGIKYGTTRDWEMAWEVYKNSNVPSEKDRILIALGKTHDPILQSRLLEYSLDPKYIKTNDILSVFSGIAYETVGGTTLAWNFLRKKWKVIEQIFEFNLTILMDLIFEVGTNFQTQKLFVEFSEFSNNFLKYIPLNIQIPVREKMAMKKSWVDNNLLEVKRWLREHQ